MAPATATDEISPDQQIPFIVQAYYTNTAKREYNYRPTVRNTTSVAAVEDQMLPLFLTVEQKRRAYSLNQIFVFFTCPALSG
uniref:Uncharacterized protein n=2 Tax=Oryza TaxID=4527 RepID=Q10RD9_ORYSJ|nr:hypothetical protein LOC_Os03g06690 [Oryza sativa Japonica Group]